MTLTNEKLWLVEVFQTYRKKHKLPDKSVIDLLNAPYRDNLQIRHIDWLVQFMDVWEIVEYNCNTKSVDT
jgi:hypothetical protein|tara:strand:+ start:818 stop:1027 length:210 start_codon:yes stop_codon:yes gene_type:complete